MNSFTRSFSFLVVHLGLALGALACGASVDSSSSPGGSTADAATADGRAESAPASSDAVSADAGPLTTGATVVASPLAPNGACPSVTANLCKQAAQCAGNGHALFAHVTKGTVVATEDHLSEADCRNYYAVLVCPKAGALDVSACAGASLAVSCISTKEGSALVLPEACRTP